MSTSKLGPLQPSHPNTHIRKYTHTYPTLCSTPMVQAQGRWIQMNMQSYVRRRETEDKRVRRLCTRGCTARNLGTKVSLCDCIRRRSYMSRSKLVAKRIRDPSHTCGSLSALEFPPPIYRISVRITGIYDMRVFHSIL